MQSGMYVIVDLSFGTEAIGINPPSYTVDVYNSFTAIIDEFQQFDNTLAFFVATEVFSGTPANNTANLSYVRAAARDLRQYMKDQNYRSIPIGYSAADIVEGQTELVDYLTNTDGNSAVDFVGLESYEWCGSSSFTESGYSELVQRYQTLGSPLIFSQYGCNIPSPRVFDEVSAIYSTEMTNVLSGGVVFEYFNAVSDFGKRMSDLTVVSADANGIQDSSALILAASVRTKILKTYQVNRQRLHQQASI